MKLLLLVLVTLLLSTQLLAQNQNGSKKENSLSARKGSFFFYWGYNRSIYSKTNIHFTGPNYDFTVYDVTGADRPSKFGRDYYDPTRISIPQYNFRLGYHLTDRLVLSGGMDHMKYVVDQNQEVRISGVISEQASEKYAGAYLNDKILLDKDFLIFDHTNGFNLLSLDFEYLQPLGSFWKNKLAFHWNTGIGGIWIVTKTNVRVMGDGLDNDFHIAGYSLVGKTGPRIEYKKRWFALVELKGGYASLPSVLIKNAEPEIGDHNLTFLEYYFAVGCNFRIPKRWTYRKEQPSN